MANELVQSGNLRLTMNNKPVLEATNCTLSLAREVTQRAATKDTAAGANTKGQRTWSATVAALQTYAGDGATHLRFEDLFDLWKDDTDTLIEVEFVPDSGESSAEFYYKGSGIITQMDSDWTVDEDGTVSATITGSGDIDKVDIVASPPAS
jgi:hypothetical protein